MPWEDEGRQATFPRDYESLRVLLQLDDGHRATGKGGELFMGHIVEVLPAIVDYRTFPNIVYLPSCCESPSVGDGVRVEMLSDVCRPSMVNHQSIARS